MVAGLVIVHRDVFAWWEGSGWSLDAAAYLVAFCVLVPLGMLMVSRVPYVHAANRLLRGKRTIGGVALILLAVVAVLHLDIAQVLAAAFALYALSGPACAVLRRLGVRS